MSESNIIYLARVERHKQRLLRKAREARLREQLAPQEHPFSDFTTHANGKEVAEN